MMEIENRPIRISADIPQELAMEITPVNRNVEAMGTNLTTSPVDRAAENREVVQAVKALNQTEMFGDGNELTFQRDQKTQRMVIRLVNRQTDEVVTQIPPEYVLELAKDLRQQAG
jgi:uncharacterized FlaG/YvyC family protein